MRRFGLALGMALVMSAGLMALVTFDPATGTGFVGKGDVQSSFAWNNAGLQSHASGVTFSFDVTERRYKDCVDNDNPNNGQIRLVDERHQTKEVTSQIQYDARTHKQIDGFILTGFGATTQQGGIVNNKCPDGFHPANGDEETGWSDWTILGEGSALYVKWGGTGVQIWP